MPKSLAAIACKSLAAAFERLQRLSKWIHRTSAKKQKISHHLTAVKWSALKGEQIENTFAETMMENMITNLILTGFLSFTSYKSQS